MVQVHLVYLVILEVFQMLQLQLQLIQQTVLNQRHLTVFVLTHQNNMLHKIEQLQQMIMQVK